MRKAFPQIEGWKTIPCGNGTIDQAGAAGAAIHPCASTTAPGRALLALRRLCGAVDLNLRQGAWGGISSLTATDSDSDSGGGRCGSERHCLRPERLIRNRAFSTSSSLPAQPAACFRLSGAATSLFVSAGVAESACELTWFPNECSPSPAP
jgi:hypothetical protein